MVLFWETIMQNTHETITLPDFAVQLVSADASSSVSLLQLVKDAQLGLILYFYPKDNTQGCSVQAVEFSQLLPEFLQKGYQVVGVSRDGIKSHQNFIAKKALGIGLISDTDEALCQHFDVIKEKMLYGKTHLGVVRSTFVFDGNAQMIGAFRNVKAKDHAKQLLAML